jgi:Rap/ran-GAP
LLRGRRRRLCDGNVWARFRELALCVFTLAMDRVDFSLRREIIKTLPSTGVTGPLIAEHCLLAPVHDLELSQRTMPQGDRDCHFLVDTQALPAVISVRVDGDEVLICQRRATSSSVSRALMSSFFPNESSRRRSLRDKDDFAEQGATICNAAMPCDGTAGDSSPSSIHSPGRESSELTASFAGTGDILKITEEEAMSILNRVAAVNPLSIHSLSHVPADSLEWSLKDIDAEVVPSLHRIGVAFVAHGDGCSTDILSHKCGTDAYHKFTAGLGNKLSLPAAREAGSNHDERGILRYTGVSALPDDGEFFIAHRERAQHVVFHEATLIKPVPDDSGCCESLANLRIRDLLNLQVIIIWNDAGRRFDPASLRSQCLFVFIVVSPTPDESLFRVKVIVDETALPQASFGPLTPGQEGHVVHEDALTYLVRQTAANASICCLSASDMYLDEIPTGTPALDRRLMLIRKLAETLKYGSKLL